MFQSLNSLLTWYQELRVIGENILIAGLVGEFLVIAFLHNGGKQERVGTLIGTLLILIGVGIENFAGGNADDVIRRMRAPRSLSVEQQEKIASQLRQFAGQEVNVFLYSTTGESASFGKEVLATLGRADLVTHMAFGNGESFRIVTGVLVEIDPEASLPTQSLANSLVRALRDEQIDADGPKPSSTGTSPGQSFGLLSPTVPLKVTVGLKPGFGL
jgi:hypothetical protein